MGNRCLLVGAAITLAAGALVRTEAQSIPGSVKDGVYTTAQATQGKPAYDQKCAECHGSMASVTPDMAPLLNDHTFRRAWKDRSVGDFFERIRDTMPQNEPGTLSPQEVTEIIAYILSANGLPAGDEALAQDVDALKQIQLDAEP